MSVLVWAEYRGDVLHRISLEAVSAGKRLASGLGLPLVAAVAGEQVEAHAAEIARRGAGNVFAVEHKLLAEYNAEAYTAAVEQLLTQVNPTVVVFPHSYQVRDFAPRVATRFGQMLLSDVVEAQAADGTVTLVRQLFQGKLNAEINVCPDPIAFISVQAGAFRAAEMAETEGTVERFDPDLDASRLTTKSEPPFREAQRTVDLSAAELIVSVGRGIKEKENLPIAEELAAVLGAELAASRPICDNGWLPMERQVGSSGQTVAPKAYFALGISGAIQHLVGMKGAKTVVAINKDENAPIFEVADYGIVGDLFEVVPALIEELRKVKT